MKCQKCDKVATFHITELTGSAPEELHLCEEHAQEYLHRGDARDDAADENAPCERGASCSCERLDDAADAEENFDDASLKELTEDLMATDFQACPYCGLGFQEFRKSGRLGCANDYRTFQDRLEPLLLGVHGAVEHVGKRPSRFEKATAANSGATLVRLRNELNDAIETEDYERASVLRDRINELTPKIA